jgi:hypothetical protein
VGETSGVDICLSPEETARMELPVWFEIATFVGLSVLLLADLALVVRRPHEPSMKEASLWVTFYVSLALIFGLVLWGVTDGRFATEFYAGWLTEYSLSVDNLFVFVIIMARFRVPRYLQQEVLMIGILIAIVLRGLFILAGAVLISRFGSSGTGSASSRRWSSSSSRSAPPTSSSRWTASRRSSASPASRSSSSPRTCLRSWDCASCTSCSAACSSAWSTCPTAWR